MPIRFNAGQAGAVTASRCYSALRKPQEKYGKTPFGWDHSFQTDRQAERTRFDDNRFPTIRSATAESDCTASALKSLASAPPAASGSRQAPGHSESQ